jgi:cobalt-zinc-cadmium efflux system outer membrane protein
MCGAFSLLLGALTTAGCARIEHQPEPLQRDSGWEGFAQRTLEDDSLRQFLSDTGMPSEIWPLPAWDFERLTLAMLHFNPDLEVSRARWRLRLAEGELASQRPGPRVDVQLEHHSDTSDGNDSLPAWSAGFVFELLIERAEKRNARREHWQALAAAARLDVEAQAWQLRAQLRDQLLARRDIESRLALLEERQTLIEEAVELLRRREQLGQAGSFEVGTMRLELSRQTLAMAQARVERNEVDNEIARIIGITPAAWQEATFDWQGIAELSAPDRLDSATLQRDALLNRHDLGKALEDYAAEEWAVKLAIESQYPDITLSPGYLFDQNDNVWMVGISWLSALLHNHGPAIEAALARRELAAARFRAMQAAIISRVLAALANYRGRYALIAEARNLLAAQQTRRDLIERELELGYADRLDALRAQLELIEAEIALHDARVAAMKAYGTLENTIQRPMDKRMTHDET